MQLQIGVKVLIKNSKGLYLFLQRKNDSANLDKMWDIPGGRIEIDENLQDALVREVREETGLTLLGSTKLIAAQDIFVQSKDLHVVRLTYTMNSEMKEIILSKEHQAYQWLSLHEAAAIDLDPYLREVITTLDMSDL